MVVGVLSHLFAVVSTYFNMLMSGNRFFIFLNKTPPLKVISWNPGWNDTTPTRIPGMNHLARFVVDNISDPQLIFELCMKNYLDYWSFHLFA